MVRTNGANGTVRTYVRTYVQTSPGLAAEAYAAIKAAKYADQPNFVPFIVETAGYINRRAHLFLDTLQGPRAPPTPGPRGTSGDRHPKTSRSGVALHRSLSQLAAVYPPKTHVVLGAHVCPFQPESCDITI